MDVEMLYFDILELLRPSLVLHDSWEQANAAVLVLEQLYKTKTAAAPPGAAPAAIADSESDHSDGEGAPLPKVSPLLLFRV